MDIDGDLIDIIFVFVILYFILLPEYFGQRQITSKAFNTPLKENLVNFYYQESS